MEYPQASPQAPEDFVTLMKHLPAGDSLILDKKEVTYLDFEGRPYRISPVEYANLSYFSDIRRPLLRGEYPTDRLTESARELSEDGAQPPSPFYPQLSVVNDETGASTTETLDVARLIAVGRLPVYALTARSSRGGERIRLDVESLLRNMAQKVGASAIGLVVKNGEFAEPIREIAPAVEVRVQRGEEIDRELGRKILFRCQEKIAEEVMRSAAVLSAGFNSKTPLLSVPVGTLPPIEPLVAPLIDTVAQWGGSLRYMLAPLESGVPTHRLVATTVFTETESSTVLADTYDIDLMFYNASVASERLI